MASVSTKLLEDIARRLARLGHDSDEVLRRAGLSIASDDVGDRLPAIALERFWCAAEAVTGDPCIGVAVGRLARIDSYGPVGELVRASATLGEALLKTARYTKLVNDAVTMAILVDGDRALVWYRSSTPELRHPAWGAALMAVLLVLSRELTGIHLVPDEARFPHAAPPDAGPYRELFGDGVRFGCAEYALAFPEGTLTLPVVTHARAQDEASGAEVDRLTESLPAAPTYSSRAEEAVRLELGRGSATLESIAERLGVHPKTLTRRLREEGTSYRELLLERRRQLAVQYIATSDLKISEVASLLGFSDLSAFTRAFKRWCGVSPVAYRQEARGRKV